MDHEGGRMKAGCIRIPVRRIVARLFSPHGKKKARVRYFDSVRIRNFSDHVHQVAEFSDSTPRTIDPELQRREYLFSIGVSCYLLHLIATGREEINKIVELRNDLDKFLECRKEDLRRKHQEFPELRNDIDKFLEYHNNELRRKQQMFLSGQQEQSSTTSEVLDGPESSTDHYYSPHITDMTSSESLKHYVFKPSEDFGGEMDQLEAELEAEFELLQIGQDQDGKSSKLNEVSEKSEDSQLGLRCGNICLGPVEEQQGVCPYELERRLYELMETRQDEEIKELEIALEDAKEKLHLKENEASWWKDTAYIVSERIQ